MENYDLTEPASTTIQKLIVLTSITGARPWNMIIYNIPSVYLDQVFGFSKPTWQNLKN